MHSSRIRILISLKKHTGPKLLNVSVYFQMNCGGSINNELISNIFLTLFFLLLHQSSLTPSNVAGYLPMTPGLESSAQVTFQSYIHIKTTCVTNEYRRSNALI